MQVYSLRHHCRPTEPETWARVGESSKSVLWQTSGLSQHRVECENHWVAMQIEPGLFVGKHEKQIDNHLSITQAHNCEDTGPCDQPAVVTMRDTSTATEFSHGALRPLWPRADGSGLPGLKAASTWTQPVACVHLAWLQIQECLADS